MRLHGWIVLIVALFAASCTATAKPALEIQQSWVQAAKISELSAADLNASCICDVPPAALSTYAFMHIQSNTSAPDQLLKAQSDAITRIEFRRNNLIGNLTNPAPVDSIDIPANGQIVFGSGGYSMVFMGMKKDLKVGETLPLTLFFKNAGQVNVTLEIRAK